MELIKRTMLNAYAVMLMCDPSDAEDALYDFCCEEIDATYDPDTPFDQASDTLHGIAADVGAMAEAVLQIAGKDGAGGGVR